jgi:superoxide dismutase, Fe-Mn family
MTVIMQPMSEALLVEKYPGLATTSPVAILTDFTIVPEAVRAPVRNNLGGHRNHSFFW